MPRHTPSNGVPDSSAAPISAASQASRSGAGGPVRGSRPAPYRVGSTSGPPATTTASSRATVRAANSGASGGSNTARPPASRTIRAYPAGSSAAGTSHTPQRTEASR